MLQPILILFSFIVISVLMIKRVLPTILALPILAIVIALIGGVPVFGENSIMTTILEAGVSRMQAAVFVAIIGSWLGEMMVQSGISNRIIRFAAELGGDKPYVVVFSLAIATAILFTTIGGLGGSIMIGTITLPIMMSFGFSGLTAAGMMLLSMGTGIAINVSNWVVYQTTTGVDVAIVKQYAFIMAGLTAVATVVYGVIELRKIGTVKQWAVKTETVKEQNVPMISLITPLIPLILVVGFKWAVIPAFFAAIVYAAVTLFRPVQETINFVSKTAIDGVKSAGPGVLLLMGIGMLLNAVMHESVTTVIEPLLSAVIPSNPIGYVLFFVLCAPLALYRGPLNLWGLGSGILAMIINLQLLSPAAGMGALLATERVQAIADPTNSHNVWISNFVGCNVNDLMKKLLPYAWAVTAAGVIISAFMYL